MKARRATMGLTAEPVDLLSSSSLCQPHREMRGAAMSLPAAASGFVVFLLFVSAVQGQSGWEVKCNPPQICASKGSTAEIHCTYRYPPTVTIVTNKFWFTKQKRNGDYVDLRTDPEYSGRVKYDCDQNKCTLRITDVTDRDSAEYKFVVVTDQPDGKYTGLPGVTLSVADLQVQVNSLEVQKPFSWAEMTCRSSCRLPGHLHYAWFKNEWKIWEEVSDSYSDYVGAADVYSCAIDGYEASRSPPVYAPKLPSVWVSPSGVIVEGCSVNLTCSSDANPAANYTWYKENQTLLKNEQQLVFRSIRSSDTGQYFCTAENKLGRKQTKDIFLDVKYAPKLPSVSVSPSGEIVEGSSVTLTCSSDANPAATYTLYKESQTLLQGPEGIYRFTSISSTDSGIYLCKSENQYGQINSPSLCIDVLYAPKLPSVSVSPSGEIKEGSSVTLTCSSDANPAANYTWYKENEDSPKASGQNFTITDFIGEHSGNYYCEVQNKRGRHNSTLHLNVVAGNSAVIMNIIRLTLMGLMVIPLLLLHLWMRKKKTVIVTAEPHEPVEMIEVDPSPVYEYISDTEPKEEGNLVGHQPDLCLLLVDHSGKLTPFFSPHREMSGAAMSSPAAARGFAVFLLFASVAQGEDVWEVTYTSTQICALKGSTVDIECSYRYPTRINGQDTEVQEEIWFKGDEQIHLQRGGDKNCALRIRDLRESNSAEYKFMFTTNQPDGKYTGSPGVTVTVADLQVQVDRLEIYQFNSWAEMKCQSSCRLPGHLHYTWYKNGLKIWEQASDSYSGFFYPADSFSCAVRGYEMFPSPPVYAPKRPSVSVSPSIEIVEGSSVTLTCSSDANPAASYTWYKRKIYEYSHRFSKEPQIVFRSIQSSDTGQYFCRAENKLGRKQSEDFFVDVKYAPKLPSVSVSPSIEIEEGSSVTLTCSSVANPAASYTWYKRNANPDPLGKEPQLVFRSIQSSDAGQYFCRAENKLGKKRSEDFFVDVKYAPKLRPVSVSPSVEIVEGSSVTLTCNSDANPAASYTWYKETGHESLHPLGKEPQLVFMSIQSSDAGQYFCTAENELGRKQSEDFFVDVKYAPKLPSVSVSPSGEIVEGSSVTLTCSSDANPAANYTWYKESKASPQASGQSFTITDSRPEHSGNYYCEAQNRRGSLNNTLHLSVVAGAGGLIAAVTIPVVLLVIISLSVFLWIRKKRASNESSETEEGPGNRERGRIATEQDDLQYASILFSSNQSDLLYSNIRPAQPLRHMEQQEATEYSAIKYISTSSALRTGGQEEDPAALYSTVNKS
ncbi:hemicentin-1-like [Chelmon rostratus]|uniref:hemicentin-1-like n=1 Tax=Chelmon rostratus TaxID=109905 RepID=UPI001BE5D14A|nr:hemicentin-1-like [Chelmon rostratus]